MIKSYVGIQGQMIRIERPFGLPRVRISSSAKAPGVQSDANRKRTSAPDQARKESTTRVCPRVDVMRFMGISGNALMEGLAAKSCDGDLLA
jgi:hypothetical protein